MNKTFLSILIILLSFGKSFPQVNAGTKADSVHQRVVELYNLENMSGIYALTDSSFRQFIAQEDFVHWLQGTKTALGKINRSVYSGMSDGFYIYKTDLQRGTANLLLAFDPRSKISGFAIRPVYKDNAVNTDNSLSDGIDSLVENVLRPYVQQTNTFGVSVGVISDGHEFKYNYGETGKNDRELPDAHTIYEIGSITKTFTATLLAGFVLSSRCRLDDPANDYLPSDIPLLEKEGRAVTLKMLANHTSGLPRIPSDLFMDNGTPEDPYRAYDTTRLYHYLDTVKLRTVPGRQLSYSNLGFGLLGTLLARESGESWQALLDKYICEPLNMADTGPVLSRGQQQRFARGHDRNGQVTPHWHFSALAGCGAIRSSVHDMLKYLEAHVQPDTAKILGKAIRFTEKVTYSDHNDRIGLGWFLVNDLPGTYWHNGGTGGFSTFCAYNPEKKIAVVILSNSAVSVDAAGIKLIHELARMP